MKEGRGRTEVERAIRSHRLDSLVVRTFLVSFLLILLPLAVLNIVLYQVSRRVVEAEAGSLSLSSLRRTRDVLDSVFRQADYVAASVATKEESELYVMASNPGAILAVDPVKTVAATLKTLVYSNEFILSIYLYSAVSDRIVTHVGENTRESFPDTGWYDAYRSLQGGQFLHLFRRVEGIYPYVISCIKPLYPLGRERRYGAVVVNVDVDQLRHLLSTGSHGSPEALYVVDERGVILFSGDREMLGRSIAGTPPEPWLSQEAGRSYLTRPPGKERRRGVGSRVVSVCRSLRYPWTLVSFQDLEAYKLEFAQLQRVIVVFILLGIAATLLTAWVVSARAYRPIKRILRAIERPQEVELLEGSSGKRAASETRRIASTIARFMEANSRLRAELDRYLRLVDRTRAAALQSQINPHFLYNTLEAVNMTARGLTGGENDVSRIVSRLSRLLRISLETRASIVPVGREIEHARLYLDILSVRYGDKFSVMWDVPEEVRECGILRLSLQPLIENAFYHGIKPTRRKGTIHVSLARRGELLLVEVRDTGRGLSEKRLEELNAAMADESALHADHVGMRNVNQRIKLTFGAAYGVSIEATGGNGRTQTVVRMTLPVVEAGQEPL